MRRRFQLPMTCAEITRKVEAWKEIFGTAPRIMLDGQLTTFGGELAFLRDNRVASVGRKYVEILVDNTLDKVDPAQITAWENRAHLVLEGEE